MTNPLNTPLEALELNYPLPVRRYALRAGSGGGDGAPGRKLLNGQELPGETTVQARSGDRLRIETPGGGGYGDPG